MPIWVCKFWWSGCDRDNVVGNITIIMVNDYKSEGYDGGTSMTWSLYRGPRDFPQLFW